MDFSFLDEDSFDTLDRSAREELYTEQNYETSDMELPEESGTYKVENIVLNSENDMQEDSILPAVNFVSFDDVMSEDGEENKSAAIKEEVPFEEDDEEPVSESSDSDESDAEQRKEEIPLTTVEEVPSDVENAETPEDVEVLEEAEDLESLTNPDDSVPFMFTRFAANNNNITELESENADAIVESEDGTYHIEGVPALGEFKLDKDFKKLVEAVLK